MSGGMEEASALGAMGNKLAEASYQLRDAIEEAEAGYRGVTVNVEHTANKILLPTGWKLVRAEKYEGYR